ncbi:MAG: hypothetical protein VX527_01705 [Planctomycetota bacterium]|nr:hypothetical protein [Planctomycetota bacterium]
MNNLDSATRRARRLLVSRRLSVLIAIWVVVVLAMIAIDWMARFSNGARITAFIILIAGTVLAITLWLLPTISFRPSRGRLALQLERLEPDLKGRLASGIEFESSGLTKTSPLAAASVAETRRRLHGVSVGSMINPNPAWRALVVLVIIILGCLTWIVLKPEPAQLGFTRVLTPWSSAQWPPRTAVASRMHQIVPDHRVHGRGLPLLLRAENLTPNRTNDPIEATYRFIEDGQPSAWTVVMLTHQRDGVHERLIPTSGEAIEVSFMTSDAETETERILLMPLPKIEDMSLTVEPPEHAKPWKEARLVESSPGSNGLNFIRPPVLEGSRLQLDVKLNRSITIPREATARSQWLDRTFGLTELDTKPVFIVDDEDRAHWSLTWEAKGSQRMLLSLEDEFGLESIEPTPIHIPVEQDHPPDVVLLEPEQDLDVLPTAVIPLVAEAVDNLPLRTIGITVIRGDDDRIAGDELEASSERSRIESPLDLASSGAKEGDVLRVRGVASDRWRDDAGEYRQSESRIRTLRVVSEPEFLSQLRDQLALLEQRAMDLENAQRDLQDRYQEIAQAEADASSSEATFSEADPTEGSEENAAQQSAEELASNQRARQSMERRQADISRRIGDQRLQTTSIRDWLQANSLSDEQIETVLDQVEEALADGEESSAEAMRAMESSREAMAEAGSQENSGENSGENSASRSEDEQARVALESQQEVREALQDVVAALAEDQESWLLSRKLDNIESRQQALRDQTRSLAQESRGQRLEELSSELQSEIEDAAREQESLVDAVSELAESMKAQAEAMQEMDPAGAMAMERAAEMAEEQQLESMMSEAADDIEDGRLEMAGGSQQQAMEALEAMQAAMSPNQQDRIADLLRRLTDLKQTIQQLITAQASELAQLDDAIEASDYEGRDTSLITIRNHTLAVSDEARSRSESERGISRRLERAGDSQADAISVLRTSPIEGSLARDHELVALQQLEAALEQLMQMEEQAKQDLMEADRESLAQAYRELGQMQVDIQVRTTPLVDADLSSRRVRHEARRLSVEQATIGDGARLLREDNADIDTRPIFVLMHERVETASDDTTATLSDAQLESQVIRTQARIARDLMAMADSLEDDSPEEEDFERGSQAGGGGGGGGQEEDGVLPPIAELRLLRTLQVDVLEATRLLDRDHGFDPAVRSDEMERLSKLQADLARLGQEMFDRHMNSETPDLPTGDGIPPSFNRLVEPNETEPESIETKRRRPRSLDDLLGLDDIPSPETDPTPLPADHDPLEAIVEEMDRASLLIGEDQVTGPPTQRLQQDIIRRIDSLIDQARQQQSSRSSSSGSSSSNSEQSQNQSQGNQGDQAGQQGQAQQTGSQPQGAEGSDGRGRSLAPGAEEARLGGVLEETDEEWGTLPDRVRELLRQGRRDTYSNVYEQLTGEYYRRLAEQKNEPE